MPQGPQFHPHFGVSVPESGWVPAPRYLLRRDRVLRMIRSLPAGRLLEVGCGSGALIEDLTRAGYSCEAIETSPEALRLASAVHKSNPGVRIHAEAQASWRESFDYIFSFEVLEHIKDDHKTLSQWTEWLKSGGYVLISVPAHHRRWNASDVWAGHFRRYERDELEQLLAQAGFNTIAIECYGFPLANIIEPIRGYLHRRALAREGAGSSEDQIRALNTSRSGTQRTYESRFYPLQSSAIGTAIMRLSFALQSLFIRTEFGTGYLALAQKR
jgi:SAM-dependent methyltransferase